MSDLDPWVPDRGPRDGSTQTCVYAAVTPDCGLPATWHVRWDQDRHSMSCDQHMAVIQARWLYLARHHVHPDCGMPNASWLEDRCEVPSDPAHGYVHITLPRPAATRATP